MWKSPACALSAKSTPAAGMVTARGCERFMCEGTIGEVAVEANPVGRSFRQSKRERRKQTGTNHNDVSFVHDLFLISTFA
jgi:hypothetical protein